MQNKSLIKENILSFLEFKELTKYKFYQKTGISRSVLDKNGGMSEENTAKFVAQFPEVNITWLLTGKGDMLNTESSNLVMEATTPYGNNPSKTTIPYYNLPVSAGHSPFDIEGALKPDGYIVDLPGTRNTEAFLPVHGYSMHPEVKEGAIIGVKTADSWDHLNTQHKYLIITSDDRMIKYIEHDESNADILWCVSPNYKRFSVLKDEIIKVYRVTFVMNPE